MAYKTLITTWVITVLSLFVIKHLLIEWSVNFQSEVCFRPESLRKLPRLFYEPNQTSSSKSREISQNSNISGRYKLTYLPVCCGA